LMLLDCMGRLYGTWRAGGGVPAAGSIAAGRGRDWNIAGALTTVRASDSAPLMSVVREGCFTERKDCHFRTAFEFV
jgi:hypothetical protein